MSPHGKAAAYRQGCRCEICVSALPHRTVTAYTNWRCRCPDCRAAMAGYRQRLRQSYAEAPPADIPHGTIGGYDNYACRCEECRTASSERGAVNIRKARERRRAAAPGGSA